MDPITAALAAGAAAGLTGVASQAVMDAYAGLTSALRERFPKVEVNIEALEARPASEPKQASLAEELKELQADRDAELMRLALALVEAIEREAPQAAASAGVDLERVKAEFLNVQRVSGAVRFREVEATRGGINITDIGQTGRPALDPGVGQTGGPDPNS